MAHPGEYQYILYSVNLTGVEYLTSDVLIVHVLMSSQAQFSLLPNNHHSPHHHPNFSNGTNQQYARDHDQEHHTQSETENNLAFIEALNDLNVVVECMASPSCVPIVSSRDASCVAVNETGFVSQDDTISSYATQTAMSIQHAQRVAATSTSQSADFGIESFKKAFYTVMFRGTTSRHFNHVVQSNYKAIRRITFNGTSVDSTSTSVARYYAVIVEPGTVTARA
jgi:hypothetical protein